jgi:hydroxyacylglutathione hydrolase
MSEFRMKTLVLGIARTNCYIINNGETKEAIVVDPADEAGKIEQYLKANDLVCKGILLTHGHFDHILAAKEIALMTDAKIYAPETEMELLLDPNLNCSNQLSRDYSLAVDILLKDQQELKIAGFKIKVIHTPGHTAGSSAYYISGHGILISGDTLFRETVGRSDLPTGDSKILIASILDKLMILEDQVKVYPGHGDSTTIGYERDNNIYLSHNPFY